MVTNLDKKPTIPVTEIEQSAFCQTDDDLSSRTLQDEFEVGVRWQKLPVSYMRMNPEQIEANIRIAREQLADRALILGHHYQRDEVIQFADIRGDSFKLSQFAAEQDDVEFIIFCGVHFMAETADILSNPSQRVILPNLTAGCSMADMAQTDDVLDCWDDLNNVLGEGSVIPVTYMNSTAEIKSLCGKNGGIVCTSSNASATFDWSYSQGEKVLFLPDQHLGRNTAAKMGMGLDEMILWNPFKPLGGNTLEDIKNAKLILWEGHCSVHTRFTVSQINEARLKHPDVNIVVHPECTLEVVNEADSVGSTEHIKNVIEQADRGTTWAVGTEISLVNRIASENPDKNVFCLDSVVCPCSTMYRIHPAYVSWVLDGLVEGVVVNQIKVDDDIRRYSKIALERMLSIV
ncbi:MAG: quinolinate synthase NadA [Chloroflexota bacterium]|nr:quinolinate synthase NadA [Chloroflexota bacterium]